MADGAGMAGLFTNIFGGMVAANEQANARAAAADRIQQIADMYNRINMPELGAEELNLEKFNAGQMVNNQMQDVNQLSSQDALQNVNLDPRLKQTQMNALEILKKISGSGFTPDELNAMNQQREQREGDLTSKLKQLQQQQDMRGVGNSDMALAQRMMEAQGSANRGAQDARDMQAQAFKRSLDAVSQGANLAGNIDATDYSRQAQLAQNLNSRELNNFNAKNTIQGNNVDRFNNALSSNVNRLNTTGDKNVALSNDQQQYNKGLLDKRYNRQMDRTAAMAGVNRTQAGMDTAAGNARAGAISGVASGIGSAILASGSGNNKSGNDEMTQFELDNME